MDHSADLLELSQAAAVHPRGAVQKCDRFKLETLDDLLAEPEPEFAVDGLLKRGDLMFAYGPAKSYKTYAVIDLAALLLRGSGQFAGQFEVKERWRVVLVTNEGRQFLRYRFTAAFKHHDLSPSDVDQLRVVRDVPNLFSGDGVKDLIELLGFFEPDLIIFDTLARVTVGADENGTQDMGRVAENVDQIQKALGGPAVIFVHHANKSGDLRGSTSLNGAADAILKFTIERGSGRAAMKSDGMKDAPEFDPIQFTTVGVGEPRCRAVEWIGADSKQSKRDSATITRGAIIGYLRDECRDQANSATSNDISKGTGFTNKTVLDHLRRAQHENVPNTRNGVRLTRKYSKAAGRKVDQWYWDSTFESGD